MHEIGREEMIKTVGRRKKKGAAIYLGENQPKGKEDSRANIQGCLMVWSVSMLKSERGKSYAWAKPVPCSWIVGSNHKEEVE